MSANDRDEAPLTCSPKPCKNGTCKFGVSGFEVLGCWESATPELQDTAPRQAWRLDPRKCCLRPEHYVFGSNLHALPESATGFRPTLLREQGPHVALRS